jgi:hypothetical protein
MTKRTWIFLLAGLLVAICATDVAAQSRSKSNKKREKERMERKKAAEKKKKKEAEAAEEAREGETREEKEDKVPFKDKLWYGFGPQLGFSGGNGFSAFTLGVAPMVGYKIFPVLSVGPRVSAVFTNYKIQGYKPTWFSDVDAGVFIRGRLFQGLFLQGEWSNTWLQEPFLSAGDRLGKVKRSTDNQRLGAGWNNSGGANWSSEFGIFYNFQVANDVNSYASPFEYRLAFTYKF